MKWRRHRNIWYRQQKDKTWRSLGYTLRANTEEELIHLIDGTVDEFEKRGVDLRRNKLGRYFPCTKNMGLDFYDGYYEYGEVKR